MPFAFTMPKLSPTMEEGVIAKWHKKEGDFVKEGDLVVEVATDKSTVEHCALDGGWLRKILVKEGGSAAVNAPIAIFSEHAEERIEGFLLDGATAPVEHTPSPSVQHTPSAFPAATVGNRLFASPLARKLAKEKGLDLRNIRGSGPNGRILSRDVQTIPVPVRSATPPASGSYEEIPLTPIRKVIAVRLQEAKATIPHFYETQEILVDRLVAVRQELTEHGIRLTYNDFVLRAVALSLEEHPLMNSGFNPDRQTMIRFHTIDISVAVSVDSGLTTPIIRNANHKTLFELSSTMKALVKKAQEGKLAYEEYVGGSFTVSNIGMYGISEFKAIINPPQAAILAVGGIVDRPVIQGGRVVPGKVMHVTISADHRVLDGVDVAQFLKTLQKYLENPSLLLIVPAQNGP